MKVELRKIVAAKAACTAMTNLELSPKLGYWVAKLNNKLDGDAVAYNKAMEKVVDMQAHAADIHSQAADIDDTDMHAQAANMRALAVDRHKARLQIYTPWHYGKTSRCSSHRSRQLWGIWGWFVVDPGELIPEDTSGRHPGHHKVLKEPQAAPRLTSM